jgi:hypothetical protein
VWTWFELLEGHMYSDNVYFLVCIYVAIALKGITNCATISNLMNDKYGCQYKPQFNAMCIEKVQCVRCIR